MKSFSLLLIFFLVFPLFLYQQQTLGLKDGRPLGRMMEDNHVFIRYTGDICINDNWLFVSDSTRGRIVQIDINTGKKIRAISSFGQGPTELQRPQKIVIRNRKLFVYDQGFRGIKIFSLLGEFICSFRIRSFLSMAKSFAVSADNEIFTPEYNPQKKSLVSVYSIKGEHLQGIIRGDFDLNDPRKYLKQSAYTLKLDSNGNIYLLFYLERKIKKYDSRGILIWEKVIRNPQLAKKPHNDGVYVNARGGLNQRAYVYDLEIDELNRIYIIHAGGGNVMDKDGNVLFFLLDENPVFPNSKNSLHWVSVYRGHLINQTLFNTSDLRLYKITEENK